MVWHYARYVEELAQTARSIYNILLYVNTAMNSKRREPDGYPSAGPLAHLIDAWYCGAPSIGIPTPDLYDNGFADWVTRYKLHNSPLFIPEIHLTDNNSIRAFYIFGEHDVIGISPSSMEDDPNSPGSSLVQSYAKLAELMSLLTGYRGKRLMKELFFDSEDKEHTIAGDDLTVIARHLLTLLWDPRAANDSMWSESDGILLKLSRSEYIITGSDITLKFAKTPEE